MSPFQNPVGTAMLHAVFQQVALLGTFSSKSDREAGAWDVSQ